MKNYKVEATMKFTDKEENIRRDMGDVFECTQERYEFLKRNNAIKLVEILNVEKVECNVLAETEPKETETIVTNEIIEENNKEVVKETKKKKISKK